MVKGNDKLLKRINIVLLIFIFLFMVIFSTRHNLGSDELDWTIKFVDGRGFVGILQELSKYGYNLPLYYIVLKIFYGISPYSKYVLMLPSMIFTFMGILIIFKMSVKTKEERMGFYSLLGILSSYVIFRQVAWNVRPYGMLFGFSALGLLLFMKKKEEDNFKNHFLFFLIVSLLSLTHWFGFLTTFCYGVLDLIDVVKNKKKIVYLFGYTAPVLLVGIWFLYVTKNLQIPLSAYWINPPDIQSVIFVLINLVGLHFLYALGMILLGYSEMKNEKEENDFIKTTLGISFLEILIVYVYSKYINPNASLFIPRYFVVILPHLILGCSWSIDGGNEKNKISNVGKYVVIIFDFFTVCIIILVLSNSYVYSDSLTPQTSFYEMLQHIQKTEDGYDEDTLVIYSFGRYGIDYYSRQGCSLPYNFVTCDPYGNDSKGINIIEKMKYYIKAGKQVEQEFNIKDIKNYKKTYFFYISDNYEDIIEKLNEGHYRYHLEKNIDLVIIDNIE